MERTATCDCGRLSITVDGEPHVLACSCDSCQRRTGSVFGVSAYYRGDEVLGIEGQHTEYTRHSSFADTITLCFCPACGSTVFWRPESRPQLIGVAVGCFADPDFPAPTSAHHSATRHAWVHFPEDVPQHE
jgi:hypothetical protein